MIPPKDLPNSIDSFLQEERIFPPPPAFSAAARIRSMDDHRALCERAERDPDAFWAEQARAQIAWRKPFTIARRGEFPDVSWFVDGELNATDSCVDRHLSTWRRNKAAIVWEGEPGDRRVLTYNDLAREVSRFSAALLRLGVKTGDRVCIYLPMIPEAAIAMLACARIGAVHSVVFAGFSADALRERIRDAGAEVVITADGGYRKGAELQLKAEVDRALAGVSTVHSVVVVRRTGSPIPWNPHRDRWWHELVTDERAEAVPVSSDHPLFILYTSGSTGKPKGMVHTTGGYLTGVCSTMDWVFDLRDDDTFWCTADVGWVTGHSYVVYGPLAKGATVVMYEGAPLHPRPDRFWEIVETHRVTVLYTAPTAIRAFMRLGASWPGRRDLRSLRLLGTVGEPINPAAWTWYRSVIGQDRTPVVDTWWQTETGAVMIAPLPGATPTKPGSATLPLPGISARVVDAEGKEVPPGKGGYLVIDRPWPSMAKTIHGDHARFVSTYFSQVKGAYFTGDGARRDRDGYFWIMGRVDDVLNVSGHRLGTMELESALVAHPSVVEAAVVGAPDELKGFAIVAFVTLREGVDPSEELAEALAEHVVRTIGAIARPDRIRFATVLPKTRSGKILRRLLRDVAAGRQGSGDMSTLEDLAALAALYSQEE